jgi:hypothetical protein
MALDEALRTILRLIEDTAARPFGLISLLAFAGTTIAYLILRGVDQRWTGRLMWLVFASLIAVGVALSQTQQRSPVRFMPQAPGWSIASPPPASGGRTTPAATGRSAAAPVPGSLAGSGAGGPGAPSSGATGGVPVGRSTASAPPPIGDATPRPGPSSADGTAASPPAAAAGRAAPSGQPPEGDEEEEEEEAASPSRSDTIVFGRLASQEVTTGNHRCPNPDRGIVNCDNFPTRTTYRVTLEASATERLVQPELRCLDGPCEASEVRYAQVSPDGQMVEASFDVWSGPTRWRLIAFREPVPPATPER